MSKLKPQLIITGSHKKKGSFAGGIGYFLLLVIVFVLGVYVGMKVDSTDLQGDEFAEKSLDRSPVQKNDVQKSEEELVQVDTQQPQLLDSNNTYSEAEYMNDENIADRQIDTVNTGDSIEQKNISSVHSDSANSVADASQNEQKNELSLVTTELQDPELVQQDEYRLQVAAFSNIEDANEFVEQLKLKGYNAYIVTTSNSRAEVWNLIKVGNFNTAQEAWNFSTIFQSKEGGEVFVESLNRGRVYNESLEEKNNEQ